MKSTPLFTYHKENANMVEFAEYEMPLWYSNISEEHLAVRNYCGVFDISHMGRLIFEGKGSTSFLDYLVPSNILNLAIGKGVYSVLCNDSGGIIDDIIIFRISDAKYFVVVNAANLQKDLDWFNQHNKFGVKISDMTKGRKLLMFLESRWVLMLPTCRGLRLLNTALMEIYA
ncbi:MAG: hypothetical protein HYU02_08165 [Thaumarchaeota archaeon]|nr:hypothetical protein [Nitrososphaerota archaeon]